MEYEVEIHKNQGRCIYINIPILNYTIELGIVRDCTNYVWPRQKNIHSQVLKRSIIINTVIKEDAKIRDSELVTYLATMLYNEGIIDKSDIKTIHRNTAGYKEPTNISKLHYKKGKGFIDVVLCNDDSFTFWFDGRDKTPWINRGRALGIHKGSDFIEHSVDIPGVRNSNEDRRDIFHPIISLLRENDIINSVEEGNIYKTMTPKLSEDSMSTVTYEKGPWGLYVNIDDAITLELHTSRGRTNNYSKPTTINDLEGGSFICKLPLMSEEGYRIDIKSKDLLFTLRKELLIRDVITLSESTIIGFNTKIKEEPVVRGSDFWDTIKPDLPEGGFKVGCHYIPNLQYVVSGGRAIGKSAALKSLGIIKLVMREEEVEPDIKKPVQLKISKIKLI